MIKKQVVSGGSSALDKSKEVIDKILLYAIINIITRVSTYQQSG